MKQQKVERIAVRLSEEGRRKVDQVATLIGCNKSEAVRRIIDATRLEPVATIAVDNPRQKHSDASLIAGIAR